MLKSITRHREFTGPTPHSVAIIARPTYKKPADHLILEKRKNEDLRERSIADSKYNKTCDLRREWKTIVELVRVEAYLQSAWERTSDRRIEKNAIKYEMMRYTQKEKMLLEQRRNKLRSLLLAEEDQYITEMETVEETMEERREKMKERAQYLKNKREVERQALVAEKLDQKFREECEELRSEMSKQTRDAIFTDRKEQIRMKREQQQREAGINGFYAQLWKDDAEAKAVREEEETREQIERNRSQLEVLNLQKMAIETQRADERQIKQLEAEWLKEEAALRAYEEEQLKIQKLKRQKSERRAREISLKLKAKKDAKEYQEQLALDMKILQKVLQDNENEVIEDINKKKQLRSEMKRFMNYVESTRNDEKEREKQLEDFVNNEIENQWKKKDDHKRRERNGRSLLLKHVLETREAQTKEREELLRLEHEAALKEHAELREQMEEHKRLENERVARVRYENRKYQNDLEQQMNYQRKLKDDGIEKARQELNELQNAEVTYQRKLRSALANPDRSKLHPLRIIGHTLATNRAKSC